jgi:DNA-binding GntR family transcriptional regulator
MVCDHEGVTERKPELPVARVAREVRERIKADEWQHEERLPSVASLAQDHSTSKATMTKALHVLEREGLLTIVPSWGVFRA